MRKPIVRAALASLDAFGTLTRDQARNLLGMWARRAELTEADVTAILATFNSRPGAQRRSRVRAR